MFSVSVVFGSISWVLMFREKEKAETAVRTLFTNKPTGFGTETPVAVIDDFQQSIYCSGIPTAVMLEDMDAARLVHVEHGMRNVHVQSDIRTRAEADARLRMARPGPAIMSPMMGANGRPI